VQRLAGSPRNRRALKRSDGNPARQGTACPGNPQRQRLRGVRPGGGGFPQILHTCDCGRMSRPRISHNWKPCREPEQAPQIPHTSRCRGLRLSPAPRFPWGFRDPEAGQSLPRRRPGGGRSAFPKSLILARARTLPGPFIGPQRQGQDPSILPASLHICVRPDAGSALRLLPKSLIVGGRRIFIQKAGPLGSSP
jgi:hypothetical protein